MKSLFFIFFFSVTFVVAQNKYLDKAGIISFKASEATFEPVKAKNNSVTAILNSKTGDIAALALVKEFQFKNALMQEHFNENYIESDSYPKTTFKGKIIEFDFSKLSKNKKEFNCVGVLNFHGIDKKIKTKLLISIQGDFLLLEGNFITFPQDFNIKIPKIVRNKIAKEVKVKLDFKLKTQ